MENNDKIIATIRQFNRFYTVHMGFLDANYLNSDHSIAETRILFELKTHGTCTQSDIVKTLHIDKSYLSRLIHRFAQQGLVEKRPAKNDKRTINITLTANGQAETEKLIALTNEQIRTQIQGLNSEDRAKLCDAFDTIISILGKKES